MSEIAKKINRVLQKLSGHEERLGNLESWQQTQNGSIQRLEKKMDTMLYLALTTLISMVGGMIVILLGYIG